MKKMVSFHPTGAIILIKCFILLLTRPQNSCCVAFSGDRNFSFYNEIQSINGTDSLLRISKLPIVYYKFLYDSVPDRLQLGVIGPEAQNIFPEAVEVLSSTAFGSSNKDPSNPKRFTPPTVVTSFPVVDKSVLFMHGLAAVQELLSRFDGLEMKLLEFSNYNSTLLSKIATFHENLEKKLSVTSLEDVIDLKLKEEIAANRLRLQSETFELEKLKLAAQLSEEKKLMDYEENLSRNRLQSQEEFSQQTMMQQMALEKELLKRKESYNLESQQLLLEERMKKLKEIELQKLAFERERIRSEIEAKAKVEKMNEEIAVRKLQVTSRLETERFIQSIKSVSLQLSQLIQDAISHPKQLALVIGVVILMIGVFFCIRELATLMRQLIQITIGRPVLVRESSSRWSFESFARGFSSLNSGEVKNEFSDIILSNEDKARVIELAVATRNTKRSGAPYRHVLLHGPPGTGKTLIARRLAKCSGLEYAFMSGGDVSVLGEDSVNQLHSLFRWAKNSSSGLLLFIDEAEAFLCSRSNFSGDTTSENHLRNALNALLYQTGTSSKSFMMVLATNRPEDLDPAILDRVDVSIRIGLPREKQRAEMIKLYLNRYLSEAAGISLWKYILQWFGMSDRRIKIDSECLHHSVIAAIAKKIAGFSGREIAKLLIAVQYAVMLSQHRVLTVKLLQDVTEAKILEHNLKTINFRALSPNLRTSRK